MESYKHLFGPKQCCSVFDTLAKFLSCSSLKAFVSDPNNKPYHGILNEEIEILTLANCNHEATYLLCGLHVWLMHLLEKRLEGEAVTILDEIDAPKAKYSELLVYGFIEAIRDSIRPNILTERYDKMETHMERACSVSRINRTGHVRLPELPARTVDLALALDSLSPPLNYQTAVRMCGILPKDYEVLERLIVHLPDEPSTLWQVDMRDVVGDFELEICPDNGSAVSERSPMFDAGSEGWLSTMVFLNNTRLTRVL